MFILKFSKTYACVAARLRAGSSTGSEFISFLKLFRAISDNDGAIGVFIVISKSFIGSQVKSNITI